MTYKKLKTIGSAMFAYDKYVRILHCLYADNKISLVDGKHYGFIFGSLVDELNHPTAWRTLENCYCAKLKVDESGKIIASVDIWDGNTFDGSREKIRWTANFSGITQDQLEMFSGGINSEFDEFLQDKFETEEEQRKRTRIAEMAREILRGS